jgi:hypothetical protein
MCNALVEPINKQTNKNKYEKEKEIRDKQFDCCQWCHDKQVTQVKKKKEVIFIGN